MEAKKILSADILDILFDGKNKDYGAYDLRKSYSSRLVKALGGTFAIVLVCTIGLSFAHGEKTDNSIPPIETTLGEIPKEKGPVIIPPTPKEPEVTVQPQETNQVTYSTMVIKPDEMVSPKSIINTITDETAISTQTIESDFTKPFVQAPLSDVGTGNSLGTILKKDGNPDSVFVIVEKEAEFPGGRIAWRKFLENKLDPESVVDNGASAGSYTVILKFIVSRIGAISNLVALTNHGYGMEKEAIRVLEKSPIWKPAIQNGHEVNSYYSQAITFQVN